MSEQDHNYDCAVCGEACHITGHDQCPKAGGQFVARTLRCWKHVEGRTEETIRDGASGKVTTVPVKVGQKVTFINHPEWNSQRRGRDYRDDARGYGWDGGRWNEKRKDKKQNVIPFKRPEPEKPPEVAPIDADLAALIRGEQSGTDAEIRERIEKGSV